MNNWNKDLENGELGQAIWVSYVLKNNPNYEHLESLKTGDADECFNTGSKIVTFEVKTDFKVCPDRRLPNGLLISGDTGNMFIEFHQKKKDIPTGITTTKADYYVIYFKYIEEFWVIPVERLRELIKTNEFFVTSGGDNYNSLGYLIPREKYRKEFVVFHNV